MAPPKKRPAATPEEGYAAQQARWQAAAQWGSETSMNELETVMWRSERHPQASSTIASLLILDQAPDWDRLVAAVDWASSLVLKARQRVVEPIVPTGPPAWAIDPHFHIGYHLRRHQLGARASMDDLLELVQDLLITPFDRTRPLWEATLIEGLQGGRAAYLLKLHHSLTDGLGAAQLLSAVQSRTRSHTDDKPVSDLPTTAGPTAWEVTTEGLRETISAAPMIAATAAAAVAGTLRDPSEAVSEGLRFAASLRRVLTPKVLERSPLLAGRDGRRWVLQTLECRLDTLRAAGRAAGGSVNDAYLAALLGGMRRYHEAHGVDLEELQMTVPVSLRRADDPMGGNRFAGAMIAGPMGIEDPVERIAILRGVMLSEVNEPALDTFSLFTPIANRLPSAVGAAAMRLGSLNDLAASNVPGISESVYLAGAKVERAIPFGPLPGVAVMAVLGSYAGVCSVGFTLDDRAIESPALFAASMREGFDEVLALA